MYEILKEKSILLLGERYPGRIVWVQLYDTTGEAEEDDLRKLLLELNTQILKGSIKSGSARKFLDGKLLYYSIDRIPGEETRDKIICLYTLDTSIGAIVKKAIEAVGYRGGVFSVYSAKRFFTEMCDLLENPELLNQESVPLDQAIKKLDSFDGSKMSVNELGQLISLINRSLNMDTETLEKLYFLVYEGIEGLVVNGAGNIPHQQADSDEFLDAAYIIARKYQDQGGFHLALELYKKLIPLTRDNSRFDLEVACQLRIAAIYYEYFPTSGDLILDVLQEISETTLLSETKKSDIETYYCLKGTGYKFNKNEELAKIEFEKAIEFSKGVISSPKWISEAYHYLGEIDESEYHFTNAIRQYLTAANISFYAGDLTKADQFSNHAAIAEVQMSSSLIHSAIISHNENLSKESDYRVWDALRTLVKAYIHVLPNELNSLEPKTTEILNIANRLLLVPGKIRKNKTVLRKTDLIFEEIRTLATKSKAEMFKLEGLSDLINANIPLPPPTFILLTLDGRLIIMGEINKQKWEKSNIQGVLLSGILSAIMSLITEVSDQQTKLKTVDAGNFQILLEQSENLAGALLVDRDIPVLRQGLISLLSKIDETYGDRLKFWDGFSDPELYGNIKGYAVNNLTIN
ncbi:MAG: hypothetical protein HeimC2_30440 [Candidatus Heimdallarchaeota archaeon LC_2]|nr:MAG: hypothetical protein HeimC2_39160 [Candidatus Heimdallarchaeota archaeon LC_2]OLS22157.1 MAG: hypothetical protein HeimC2_30440 [Candidatus Heimdallarchaeota archaeon LC_2]